MCGMQTKGRIQRNNYQYRQNVVSTSGPLLTLRFPCVGSMIHNYGSCGSSLMGKTSLRSVCLIFWHQTHQNVKIRQAFRPHTYAHENRRARSGLWTIFSAGNGNFFCLWTVTLC